MTETIGTMLGKRFIEDAQCLMGKRVRTTVDYCGMLKGTEGVIDEVFIQVWGLGIGVAWDLENDRLPQGYWKFNPELFNRRKRDRFTTIDCEILELMP